MVEVGDKESTPHTPHRNIESAGNGERNTGLKQNRQVAERILCIALLLGTSAFAGFGQPAPGQQGPQQKTAGPQDQQKQPAQQKPAHTDSNPFPEDTTNVPVIGNSSPETAEPEPAAPARIASTDFDPVRSPDEPIGEPAGDTEQGFSSSSSGLNMPTPADSTDTDTGKHRRRQAESQPQPTHVETAQENEKVGEYYLSSKNWRAALSRYQSALVLDPENPDVYWGLAESQRHLGDIANARENYQKVMEYDPDSRHAKDAKKLLASPEMANAGAAPQHQ